MQTWCDCDCDPETVWMDWMSWMGDDESTSGHSQECTCEICIQDYPERGFWTQTPSGNVAHINGDLDISDETLAALHTTID